MIPPGVEQHLRAHVTDILDASHVPSAARDDLAEELYGHLAERWRSLVQGGADETMAADGAIHDFGTAHRIGGDLTRSYRGRFWASTIGVLLPATRRRAPQPRIAWWLGASVRAYGVFYAIAIPFMVANASPVRALFLLVMGVAATVLLFVAAMALPRRQRWALDLAIIVNVIGLAYGLYHMLTTPGLISLNVIGSGLLLLLAASQRERLGLWVRRSRPVGNGLAVAIILVVLGGTLGPVAAGGLPDPTQAGADDLHITASMTCRDQVPRGGTVTVELRWDRLDFLPGGIGNINGYGDMLVLEMEPLMADPFGYSFLTDVETGEQVAEPNVFPPSGDRVLLNQDLSGPAMIGIEHSRLKAGRLYRLTWEFDVWDEVDIRDVQAGVEYWHLEEYRREALIDCDGTVLDWWTVPPPAP